MKTDEMEQILEGIIRDEATNPTPRCTAPSRCRPRTRSGSTRAAASSARRSSSRADSSGTWSSKRDGRRLAVTIEPFEPLAPAVEEAVETEVADLGRFEASPRRIA